MNKDSDDNEPTVDHKLIEAYVRFVKTKPETFGPKWLEVFVLIEQCKSWYAAYKEITERILGNTENPTTSSSIET